jgi:SecD/SecF fusion protein
MPTNHLGRVLVTLFVLFVALAAIFPDALGNPRDFFNFSTPLSSKTNLKPGIDIAGGTSLLYEIKAPESGLTPDLSTRVMDALKKRVDPDGVRNLVWRPQGANRLEIQMPLTGKSGEASGAREAFGKAQRDLEATNVRLGTVMDAVERLSGDERAKRLSDLAMGSAIRQKLFADLAQARDDRARAQEQKNAGAQGVAEAKLEDLQPRIEPTNVNVTELEQTLNSIEEAKAKKAADPDQPGPSPDAIALVDRAKDSGKEFPRRAAAVEEYIRAHGEYYKVKNKLEAAADLKRLLQGSGVLEYHILVEPGDPRAADMVSRLDQGLGTSPRAGDTCRWGMVDKPEQFHADGIIKRYGGRTWVLLDTRPERSLTQTTGNRWALTNAQVGTNPQSGEMEVLFSLDAQGGVYMSRLTGLNLKKPMAIVLDDKVISAPTIQSQIGASGQISGRYTKAEINYLVSTLNAGSLPAQLAEEPISERTIGPNLGADNLRSGLLSCAFGLIVVGTFLICYYYLSGIVAFIAVLMNLVLIIGALAALNATFTLPGIAALVLTLGTAVDANVLIFERLREEQLRGFPIRTALKHAYERAFSAIFDSNVVTAIVSLVLYILGSEEVKGFGLTLLIGIAASLFTALFVTKTIFAILIDRFKIKRLSSIPMSLPWWDNALKPKFDWMGRVWVLFGASLSVMALGLVLFAHYIHKGEMFDIEFSSGTSVTLDFKQPVPIDTVRDMLAKADQNEIIVAGSTAARNESTTQPDAVPSGDRRVKIGQAIPSPSVVAVGANNMSYEIVTPNVDVPAVRAALFDVYKDVLKINVPSTFARVGAPIDQVLDSTVYAVGAKAPTLPNGTARFVPPNFGEYRGGVLIYLDNISPPLTPQQIETQITEQRLQPGATAGQNRTLPPISVYAPGGTANEPTSQAVLIAVDPKILADEDAEKWKSDIAEPMWKLVNEAINKPPSLAKVTNFDAQVAGQTQQSALVALTLALIVIMGYVWLRFGSLKYGAANTVALLHDTFFILGALGLAHGLNEYGPHIGKALLIEPFRLNLTVVAGILTIMGYSMVDTIVVFDRIREIRGQRGTLTKQVINDAINQTLSRTLLTAGTTIATLFVMYAFGGPGIHGFTYVLLVGILVGTYSSIAIAAPLLLLGLTKSDTTTPAQPLKRTPGLPVAS